MVNFNTFSITARCEKTGQLGVAISTSLPAVGALCPFAKAGVGAITTQSFINPYIGINGLSYLHSGLTADEVLERVLSEDPDPEMRQVSIVDSNGKAVSFTGNKCDSWNGHKTGKNYAVAGNMLVGEETILEMEEVFKSSNALPFTERLLQSLEAGQKVGGDKRGKQSAALIIVEKEEYPMIDLRVDDHKEPVRELRRIYEVARQKLYPFVRMLPTLKNPSGTIDFDYLRRIKILED